MKKGIPNLNTISTYVERCCIENVKKSQFKFRLDNLDSNNKEDLSYKVDFQTELCSDIKTRLLDVLWASFEAGDYQFYKEKRSLV